MQNRPVGENQKEMERRCENQNEPRYQVEKREKETTYDNNCFGKKKKKRKMDNGARINEQESEKKDINN